MNRGKNTTIRTSDDAVSNRVRNISWTSNDDWSHNYKLMCNNYADDVIGACFKTKSYKPCNTLSRFLAMATHIWEAVNDEEARKTESMQISIRNVEFLHQGRKVTPFKIKYDEKNKLESIIQDAEFGNILNDTICDLNMPTCFGLLIGTGLLKLKYERGLKIFSTNVLRIEELEECCDYAVAYWKDRALLMKLKKLAKRFMKRKESDDRC